MILGLDIGRGYTKAVTKDKQVVFPSVLGDAPTITYQNELAQGQSYTTYTMNGHDWFVGDDALVQSKQQITTLSRDGIDTEATEVFLCAAIEKLTDETEVEISLVTGLPVSWYADRHVLIDRLQGYKAFQANGEWRTIHVRDVLAVPQPIGSFFCAILDKDGVLVNEQLADGRVAVVDVGMYTSDFALSESLSFVEKGSGSITEAMSTVIDLVGREIHTELGLDLTLHQLDQVCRTGQVRVYGKMVKVERMIDNAVNQVWESIKAKATSLWGDARDIDAIVGVGGGMMIFGDRLDKMYPHVQDTNGVACSIANAVGFERYARRKFGK